MQFTALHKTELYIMADNISIITIMSSTRQTDNARNTQLDLVIQVIGDYLIFAVSLPLASFGCFSNVANLFIFIKQGRRDCVTVCLFALGMSDFLCCFTVLIFSSLYISNHVNNFSVIEPMALDIVLSYISALFYDISQGITAFIALQRCLCVAMPLKFKNMFTVTRSVRIMLGFYVLTTLAYTPHFRTCGLYLKFDSTRNITITALWESSDRPESTLWLAYLLHIGTDTFYQFVIFVSALVMISGLKRSSKFRQQKSQAAAGHSIQWETEEDISGRVGYKSSKQSHKTAKSTNTRPSPLSDKNRNVVKTIFGLSLMAIICNTERVSVVYFQRLIPGLTFDGIHRNIFFVYVRVTFLFSMVNASLNVFIYFSLNPSYRKTFLKTFCCKQQGNDKVEK